MKGGGRRAARRNERRRWIVAAVRKQEKILCEKLSEMAVCLRKRRKIMASDNVCMKVVTF